MIPACGPLEQICALPVNFANTGWGTMQIINCCAPNSKGGPYLRYVMHHSCEAESWKDSPDPRGPVCMLNAGYTSAWISNSFDTELVTAEISCRGAGGNTCEFVVASPHEIEKYVRTFCPKERIANLPTLEIHKSKQAAAKEGMGLFSWYSKFSK